MAAYSTTESQDFVRRVFEGLAYAEDDDTIEDAELTGILSVRDAADAGYLGTDGVVVEIGDEGRQFLVTAQEVTR